MLVVRGAWPTDPTRATRRVGMPEDEVVPADGEYPAARRAIEPI